ncbi:MAG: hypothetical protein DRR06_20260 [Gammaproteobacteria bacterium]|nr:MAG: hypothetical protein DRR06_20260 [Gammaproteobacteria bacterium]RLA47028.1 MAG: hypothetical protein DRR42_17880 [Gammaproteobacteria bacterium]
MNKISIVLLLSLLSLFSLEIYAAPPGTLKAEKVKGLSRYCTYTDGGILTIDHTDLCPTKNPNPSKTGSPPIVNIEKKGNPDFGPLSGQRIKGDNRYCSYTDGTVLTVGKTDTCPNTSR